MSVVVIGEKYGMLTTIKLVAGGMVGGTPTRRREAYGAGTVEKE